MARTAVQSALCTMLHNGTQLDHQCNVKYIKSKNKLLDVTNVSVTDMHPK